MTLPSGKSAGAVCPTCGGAEELQRPVTQDEFGVWDTETFPCPDCAGGGTAIWKYPLMTGVNRLRMPSAAKLLHVHEQQGGGAFLWAEVNPGNALTHRDIELIATGQEFDGQGHYIGSLHLGEFVLHAYDRGTPDSIIDSGHHAATGRVAV